MNGELGVRLAPRPNPSIRVRPPDPALVHLSAEYWPFIHTGGLGMAVSGLAHAQAAAALRTTVIVPLYRCVRDGPARLDPLGPAFPVRIGDAVEAARPWQLRDAGPGPRVVFLEHDDFFRRDGIYGDASGDYQDNARRFAFFARAALEALPRLVPAPPVLHAHDWHGALAPVYLRTALAGDRYYDMTRSVLTVHNAAFQGRFPEETWRTCGLPSGCAELRPGWETGANWLQAGVASADLVTAVSPTHARELRTVLGGFGLHDRFRALGNRLVGVRNGIEPGRWNPAADPSIAAAYSAEDRSGKVCCKVALQREYRLSLDAAAPLVGMCARLVSQKGFDLILGGPLRSVPEAQFVFVGQGDARYQQALSEAAGADPSRIAVHIGYDDAREHRLLAGADMLLMPSLYEPCGLTQMRAQRYGTIPVARRAGGLADTIEDGVTGFLFDEYSPGALEGALQRAVEGYRQPVRWADHIRAAMSRQFGWEHPAQQYADVYARAQRLHRARPARAGGTRVIRRRLTPAGSIP